MVRNISLFDVHKRKEILQRLLQGFEISRTFLRAQQGNFKIL